MTSPIKTCFIIKYVYFLILNNYYYLLDFVRKAIMIFITSIQNRKNGANDLHLLDFRIKLLLKNLNIF